MPIFSNTHDLASYKAYRNNLKAILRYRLLVRSSGALISRCYEPKVRGMDFIPTLHEGMTKVLPRNLCIIKKYPTTDYW